MKKIYLLVFVFAAIKMQAQSYYQFNLGGYFSQDTLTVNDTLVYNFRITNFDQPACCCPDAAGDYNSTLDFYGYLHAATQYYPLYHNSSLMLNPYSITPLVIDSGTTSPWLQVKFPLHNTNLAGGCYLELYFANADTSIRFYPCSDTTFESFFVDNPICHSFFTVSTTSTPGLYYGHNYSAGMNVTYHWDFGDGATSQLAYPSHTYNTPGQYNVCLTVSNNSGCSDTYCDSSFLVFKTENGLMSQLNILNPTGIQESSITPWQFAIFPNPATNQLNVTIDEELIGAQLNIYDITGSLVQTGKLETKNLSLNTSNFSCGVYLAEIKGNDVNVKRRWVKM